METLSQMIGYDDPSDTLLIYRTAKVKFCKGYQTIREQVQGFPLKTPDSSKFKIFLTYSMMMRKNNVKYRLLIF